MTLGQPVHFYTVIEATKRHGEIGLGYRLLAQAGDSEKAYGVCVNPLKATSVTFVEGDKKIVLAEA